MSIFFDTGNSSSAGYSGQYGYENGNENGETGKRLLPDIDIHPGMIPKGIRISGEYDPDERKFMELVIELSNTQTVGCRHSNRILSDLDNGYVLFSNILMVLGPAICCLFSIFGNSYNNGELLFPALMIGGGIWLSHFIIDLIYYNCRIMRTTVRREGMKIERSLLGLWQHEMFIKRSDIIQFYCKYDQIVIKEARHSRYHRSPAEYMTVCNLAMMTSAPQLNKPFIFLKNFTNLNMAKYLEQELEKTLEIDDIAVTDEIEYGMKANLQNSQQQTGANPFDRPVNTQNTYVRNQGYVGGQRGYNGGGYQTKAYNSRNSGNNSNNSGNSGDIPDRYY